MIRGVAPAARLSGAFEIGGDLLHVASAIDRVLPRLEGAGLSMSLFKLGVENFPEAIDLDHGGHPAAGCYDSLQESEHWTMAPPPELTWLFWDVDPAALECERDADYILARVLESGGMTEVRWAISTFGFERIHRFLRDVGHPELSPRTLAFWRAVFQAEGEKWAETPDWRRSSSAPWIR